MLPLGVGFAVALSAGQGAVVRPPAATLSSGGREVTAAEGAWCWRSHGRHRCQAPVSGAAGRAPVLLVSRAAPGVEVRFATPQAPASVRVTVAGPDGTGGRAVSVLGRNPGRFVPVPLSDGAQVSVRAVWPQGRVTYLVRLQVGDGGGEPGGSPGGRPVNR